MKNRLALLLYYAGISYILFRITHRKGAVRALNYHCTPGTDMVNFQKQLTFYRKYFTNVSPADLNAILEGEKNTDNNKPGLIISFDDGLRSNFEYALSLLEKNGFSGWFFVPAGFMHDPSQEFTRSNSITCRQQYSDGRYGMNLQELKRVAENHVIGCHTYSHHRMNDHDSEQVLHHEIVESKLALETMIGREVDIFCWVGGELAHYTSSAHKIIKNAGYLFSFTTNNHVIDHTTDKFNLNRTNIETNNSMPLVLFQLSGLMDLLYTSKRASVASKFAGI